MEDSGVDLPACARFETVGSRVKQNSVVTLVPFFQAVADIILGGAGLQAHIGVGEVVLYLVVLRRKVIGFGLSLLSNEFGESIALMHVVGDGSHVVKKLAKQIPSAFTLHHFSAEQEISGRFDRFFQQELFAAFGPDITQSLVGQGVGPVRRLRGRRKPALVDAATMATESVKIVRVELEPATGNHERSRNPAGLQS